MSKPAKNSDMVDFVGKAIAAADGGRFADDRARYRRLAIAAIRPLAKPTEAMVDAAHEEVWFDAYWAINNRRDFKRAMKAMIAKATGEFRIERPITDKRAGVPAAVGPAGRR